MYRRVTRPLPQYSMPLTHDCIFALVEFRGPHIPHLTAFLAPGLPASGIPLFGTPDLTSGEHTPLPTVASYRLVH